MCTKKLLCWWGAGGGAPPTPQQHLGAPSNTLTGIDPDAGDIIAPISNYFDRIELMMTELNGLSERELDVLKLLATGASNKEIASGLYISTNTVKVHLRNIYTKIGVSSRTEAALYAVNAGLVQGETDQDIAGYPGEQISPAVVIEDEGFRPISAPFLLRIFQGKYAWIGYLSLIVILFVIAGLVYIGIRAATNNASISSPADIPRWRTLPGMPTARSGLAVEVVDNMIYAVAGRTGESVTGLVEAYDPEVQRWAKREPKTTPVMDVSAAVINGRIYIPGGRLSDDSISENLEIYDPRSDTWSQGARLPVALSAYGMIAYEGNLYLFGGWDGEKYIPNVFQYNPEADVWSELQPMRTARGFPGVAAVGERIYILGGYDGNIALSTNEIFNPTLGMESGEAWMFGEPLPVPLYAMGTARIADIVYVLGGISSAELDFTSMAYYTQTEEWRLIEEPEQPFGSHFGLVSIGSNLYAIGGYVGDRPSNQVQAYQAIYTVSIPVIVK